MVDLLRYVDEELKLDTFRCCAISCSKDSCRGSNGILLSDIYRRHQSIDDVYNIHFSGCD